MARPKKDLSLPHVIDCGGDVSKTWCVEYSCRDPYQNKLQRFRVYEGFSKLKTAEERYELADRIIREIKEKLLKGWSPFEKRKVSYEDQLVIEAYARRWGRDRESVPTLAKYLSEFLDYKKATVIKHSLTTYKSKLRIFNEWAQHQGIDQIHLSFITREHIYDFLCWMVNEQNVSVRTIKKYKQILHGFFDYMVRIKQMIVKNPVHDLPDIGRQTDEAPRPIPLDVRKVLMPYMAKKDPQLWLFVQMEYYCAIRPNELRLLQLKNIDLEGDVIRVPCTISKNRMSEMVNIPRQLHELLAQLGLDKMDGNWYLFSTDGEPGPDKLGMNTFRYRFDKIRNKLGLPTEYKLYSFKHTGGVELVNAGVDVWELQRHFRHKQIDTMERYIRRNFPVKSDKIKNHFPEI